MSFIDFYQSCQVFQQKLEIKKIGLFRRGFFCGF